MKFTVSWETDKQRYKETVSFMIRAGGGGGGSAVYVAMK